MGPKLPQNDQPPVVQTLQKFAQPIIYQNGKPNFESPYEKKYKFVKRLIELDLGFHLIIATLLIVLIGVVVVTGNPFPFPLGKDKSSLTAQIANQELPKAEPKSDNKSAIYINDQVVSIDKAFNSPVSQIKLTLHGQLKKEIFGYLPYWVVDKADEIDIRLLTTVSYFGLEVDGNGEIVKESTADMKIGDAWKKWQNDPKLTAFIRKLKKNRTKVQLTFKAFNNENIEKLVRSDAAQQKFISNVLYQVSSKSLDGVNIDFEYIGTPPEDVKDKFSVLISNLNKELKRQYPKSKLTIATYATAALEEKFFDVELLANNSDALVIMGYDFRTPQSSHAGAVAPLGGDGLNLTLAINAYLEKVAPEKLILAVPYYGYGWPVKENSANSEVAGTREDALILPYAEIVDASKKINISWDENSKTPWYSYVEPNNNRRYVIHFDNTRSLGLKYDMVNTRGLQGIGIWALGMDGRNTDLAQLIADKFSN